MSTIKYILLFTLIQIVSFVLFVVGLPICAYLAYTRNFTMGLPQWKPKWAWIWGNLEDGVIGPPWYNDGATMWRAFMWSAFRNSVNNLRFVPGVSKVGRPLFYRTWFVFGRQFHCKMGWMSNGYPAFSPLGGGRGW